jgi:hypothetical protein
MGRTAVVGTPGRITQEFLELSLHAQRGAAVRALGELARAVAEMDRLVAEPGDERPRLGYHGAAVPPAAIDRRALERIRGEALHNIRANLQELLARPRV